MATVTDTLLRQRLERIVELARKIKESPASMGWDDIDWLCQLDDEAVKALAILKGRSVLR